MVLTGLLVGAVLGFAMQRGRFCVTGAFREVWIGGKTRWLTAFLIVIAVHAIGVFTLQSLGVITLNASPMPIVATVAGGLIFGYAIVLAGGCATGTYYRSAEGLVGSWIALAMYAAFAAFMKYGPLGGVTTWLRGTALTEHATVQEALGISPWWLVAAFALAVGALAVHHLRAEAALPRPATLPPRKTGLARFLFEKPWHAFGTAVFIGIIATVAWPLSAATGRNAGLGITTPSANLASWLITGDVTLLDWGVFLVLGILIGAFIAAKGSGEFRIRVPDSTTIVRSVIGGALMGVGAVLAGGCTIGNAMVNTAQFGFQGWVSFAAMVLGTGIATHQFILRPRTPAASSSTATPAPSYVTV